jgi:hypothetical protein
VPVILGFFNDPTKVVVGLDLVVGNLNVDELIAMLVSFIFLGVVAHGITTFIINKCEEKFVPYRSVLICFIMN